MWRHRACEDVARPFPKAVRLWLQDDEEADHSKEAVDARASGVYVVSAFTWYHGKVSLWLEEKVMNEMVNNNEPNP